MGVRLRMLLSCSGSEVSKAVSTLEHWTRSPWLVHDSSLEVQVFSATWLLTRDLLTGRRFWKKTRQAPSLKNEHSYWGQCCGTVHKADPCGAGIPYGPWFMSGLLCFQSSSLLTAGERHWHILTIAWVHMGNPDEAPGSQPLPISGWANQWLEDLSLPLPPPCQLFQNK